MLRSLIEYLTTSREEKKQKDRAMSKEEIAIRYWYPVLLRKVYVDLEAGSFDLVKKFCNWWTCD